MVHRRRPGSVSQESRDECQKMNGGHQPHQREGIWTVWVGVLCRVNVLRGWTKVEDDSSQEQDTHGPHRLSTICVTPHGCREKLRLYRNVSQKDDQGQLVPGKG